MTSDYDKVEGEDFEAASVDLTFAGVSRVCVEIAIINDGVDENIESFGVFLEVDSEFNQIQLGISAASINIISKCRV